MIRIWHDGAMRRLPLWLGITMMNTSVLLGLVLWRQATRGDGMQPPWGHLLVILWLAVAVHLLGGNVRTRCRRLDMTLPISTRALWWRHQSAVILAGAIVLAGSLAVLAGHAFLIRRVNPQDALEIPYLTLIAPVTGGLLLAASMIGSLEPGLWKLQGRKDYWVFVISGLGGILVILLLLSERPWVAAQFCLLMAAVITYLTLRKLPPAFRLVPRCALPADSKAPVAASTGKAVSRWQIARILFDVLHTTPPWKQFTPWLLYFFVALLGLIISGGTERWADVESLRFMYIPMGSYMILAGVGILTYHLYRFDPLPISRRALFAAITWPGIAIFLAGYLTGWVLLVTDPTPDPLVEYNVQNRHVEIDLHAGPDATPREMETMVWVEVDEAFMGVSPSGAAPLLTSPWGESHEAWSIAPLRGLPPVTYNPYNTAEETTAEFEALMTSRAIQQVYGLTITPDEIRDRYFDVADGRVVGLAAGGFTLMEDYPDLRGASRGPQAPVYLALVLVPALLLTAFFVRSFRATHTNRYIRATYYVGLGILLAALIGQAVLAVFGVFDPEAARNYLSVVVRMLGSSGLSTALTWLVSLGAIFVSYRVALRQFEEAEIPASPINCSLIDFSKMD